MDPILKVRHTLDAQFGRGSCRALPKGVVIEKSKRTGRIRGIRDDKGRLLATLRPDGGMAVSMLLARMLLERRGKSFEAGYCISIGPDAAPFVGEGRSVFCRHVLRCGRNVRAGSDVPVTCEGRVIAVGKALLSCDVISDMDKGVAVKIRDSLKGRSG